MIEIRASGLQRSGNHAILNWIAGLFDGPVWFLNNCDPNSDPLIQRTETSGLPCLPSKQPISGENPQVLIHSYEEKKLEEIRSQPRRSDRWGNDERFEVIILRDPFNTLASRIEAVRQQRWYGPLETGVEFNLLWRQYAHEFSGHTKYFSKCLPISFNRWLADREYRRSIAAVFNRPLNDQTLSHVSDYGKGSSFDGLSLLGPQMKVLDRWRKFYDDPGFRRALEDKELLTVAKELFPSVTDKVLRALASIRSEKAIETCKEDILDHAREPYHLGTCSSPTHVGRFVNPACGDFSQIEFRLDVNDRIEAAWFQSHGCMINRAGGSILTEHLEGMSLDEANRLSDQDVLNLLESQLTPRRRVCFLMTYYAFRDALSNSASVVKVRPENQISEYADG